MNKILIAFACLFCASASAINYLDYCPPSTTHVQSNGRGGYTWIESGDPSASNIYDRLPSTHTMDSDGRGGYYIR